MQESMLILMTISRGLFLLSNMLLDYSFLTSKKPLWFQVLAFTLTWAATFIVRPFLSQYITDPFLIGYLVGLLFLVPFALVFEESVHAKLFVFFMVFSLSQLNFLLCLFPNRAGVKKDDVCQSHIRGEGISLGMKDALHTKRIVFIHLAAESPHIQHARSRACFQESISSWFIAG